MTTLTLCGRLTDRYGHAEHRSYGWEGNAAVEYRSIEALPSVEYRSSQPGPIPIRQRHGARHDVGRCVHLERSADDSIVAVAQVDGVDDLLIPRNGPVYWSPELRFRRGGHDIEINELVITTSPATFALTPLELIPGTPTQAADWVRCRRRPTLAALLDRAEVAQRRRRFCGPITIEDPTAREAERRAVETQVGAHTLDLVPRSGSGRFRTVGGHRVEIEHFPAVGRVLSVR